MFFSKRQLSLSIANAMYADENVRNIGNTASG